VAKHGSAGRTFVTTLRYCASTLFLSRALSYRGRAGGIPAWVQPVSLRRGVSRSPSGGAAVVRILRSGRTALPRRGGEDAGIGAWFGGFWNRPGGHINPLRWARGLARVGGGRLPHLRAFRCGQLRTANDRWIVKRKGRISGRALFMATNVYKPRIFTIPVAAISRMRSCRYCPGSWRRKPLSDVRARPSFPAGRRCPTRIANSYFGALRCASIRLVTGGAVIGPCKARAAPGESNRASAALWPQIVLLEFDYVL